MPGAVYGLMGPQVYSQQPAPHQQPAPRGRQKQSSPVLDDFSGHAGQHQAAAAMQEVHAGARLHHLQQQHHQHYHQQQPGGGAGGSVSAGRMDWGILQGVGGPQFAAQGMDMGSTYDQGTALPHPPAAAAGPAAPGAALAASHHQQQQLLLPHAPAAPAVGGSVGGLAAYGGGGDVVLSSDFWQDIMADLAHDPGVDPAHLLHPAQVDVDMADSSRSPLSLNQQLLMLGSPPPGSTAAAAAAGAAAIMGGYSSQVVTRAAGGPTGMAAASLQQQHELFPGSSVFMKQEPHNG